jgi:hypothetical protein
MKKILLGLAALSTLFCASAYSGTFYVSVGGGKTDLNVRSDYAVEINETHISGGTLAVGGGYITDINIVLGVSYSALTTDLFAGAFDDYELNELKATLGYQFNLARHFRITPTVGVSHWNMSTRRGAFLNAEGKDKKYYNGTEKFGQINLEFPVNGLVVIYGNFSRGVYDFGAAKAIIVGVKFEF